MRETLGAKSFKIVTIVLLTLFTVVPLYVMVTTAMVLAPMLAMASRNK